MGQCNGLSKDVRTCCKEVLEISLLTLRETLEMQMFDVVAAWGLFIGILPSDKALVHYSGSCNTPWLNAN